ncbi:hypothetical protein C8R43DRAFT_942075 [Mycena crocata]|nr:hypothetical protein C8R43DRAFT_942075 [Mycena crocata]
MVTSKHYMKTARMRVILSNKESGRGLCRKCREWKIRGVGLSSAVTSRIGLGAPSVRDWLSVSKARNMSVFFVTYHSPGCLLCTIHRVLLNFPREVGTFANFFLCQKSCVRKFEVRTRYFPSKLDIQVATLARGTVVPVGCDTHSWSRAFPGGDLSRTDRRLQAVGIWTGWFFARRWFGSGEDVPRDGSMGGTSSGASVSTTCRGLQVKAEIAKLGLAHVPPSASDITKKFRPST